MAKVTFAHIHRRSPDPEATAAFHAEMFGAEIICSAPAGKSRIDLNLGGQAICIAQVLPGTLHHDEPEPPVRHRSGGGTQRLRHQFAS